MDLLSLRQKPRLLKKMANLVDVQLKNMTLCSFGGCPRQSKTRGMCHKHYMVYWYVHTSRANRERVKRRVKEWVKRNPERARARWRQWRVEHRERVRLNKRAWRNNHLETVRQCAREWVKRNRISRNEYMTKRRKSDLNTRLRDCLRAGLCGRLRRYLDGKKAVSAIQDLGCSMKELKHHLETRFLPGMSWDNWGNKKKHWSIDHIYPLSKINLCNRNDALFAVHYTNLRPMWHVDNVRKGNRIQGEAHY